MINGALAFFAGVRLLFSRHELRPLLWRMIGLLLLFMLILSASVFAMVDYLAALWIPEGDTWYWQVVAWLVWLLSLFLALVTAAAAYVLLGSAAVAPWLDQLAARTEVIVSGGELAPSSSSWGALVWQSLSNSLRPLSMLMVWGAGALIFFWLPPLAAAIWSYAGIRFLMFELIDTPASRRDWNYKTRKYKLDQERWFYLGFSGVAALLLIVPVVNLIVIPAAVVALTVKLLKPYS